MNKREPYAPPRLIVVKLNHTQAVLSQCSLTATQGLSHQNPTVCADGGCRQQFHGGDNASSS